jgi:hypothetical protein
MESQALVVDVCPVFCLAPSELETHTKRLVQIPQQVAIGRAVVESSPDGDIAINRIVDSITDVGVQARSQVLVNDYCVVIEHCEDQVTRELTGRFNILTVRVLDGKLGPSVHKFDPTTGKPIFTGAAVEQPGEPRFIPNESVKENAIVAQNLHTTRVR